jgi:transcriptional regulator with GAF, ATPase, and Fis domain
MLLAAAGLAAIVYSVAVLIYAKTSPDLGFRWVFGREIREITRQSVAGVALRLGDQVLAIGGQPVPGYLHLHQALQALRRRQPERLESPPTGPGITGLLRAQSARSSSAPWLEIDGRRFVLVRVRRSETAQELAAWCEVTLEPARRFSYSLIWFALELVIFGLGALVYWRRPTDESAALFFELCIATVGAFMGGYHWSIIVAHPLLIFPFACFGVMLPAVSLHFYLVFPRPKWFLLVYPRCTLLLVRGLPALWMMVILGLMGSASWKFRMLASTTAVVRDLEAVLGAIRCAVFGYVGFTGLVFAACLACMVHGYRRARNDVERNQVKWILFGAVPSIVPVAYTLYLAATDRVAFALGGATLPMFVASLFFILAYAVSITRYRLMHVGAIINRSVLYVAISSAVAIVYYVVVVAGSVLLGGRLGSEPSLQMLVVSGTVVSVLIALGWFRDRFQRALDRRLHRERYQLDRALRRLGDAVSDLVDSATVAQQMLEASADLLGVHQAWAYLRDSAEGPLELAARLGEDPGVPRFAPDHSLVLRLAQQRIIRLGHPGGGSVDPWIRELRELKIDAAQALESDGQLVGLVLYGAKSSGCGFTPEELSFVAALGQVATLALHSAKRHRAIEHLNGELKEKIEKISEQQRRIALLQNQLLSRESASAGTIAEEQAFARIRGSSPSVQQMLETARKVASCESAVLLRGESGTGKELLARAIHELSPRAQAPFVTVHCAALSQGLLESELFGHVKGAFTGAHRDREGRFERAHGGTLFLDEIGDISLETQTKLLRVLQEMAFERVGSSRTIQVDVRIIAATHQNLEQWITQGRFRADLFYRLNVISIRTPPLRDRAEDIFELAVSFLDQFSRQSDKLVSEISDDALECLRGYSWPGNIRELENVIERAVVLADDPVLRVEDLPEELRGLSPELHSESRSNQPIRPVRRHCVAPSSVTGQSQSRAAPASERGRLHEALAAAGGNKSEAARLLGIPRSTLFSRLRRHRIA